MRSRAIARAATVALACAFAFGAAPARATSVAPPPCTGALPLYATLGALANLDGTHRRPADVEARLEILRRAGHDARTARVGWAYLDAEGDVWVTIHKTDARGLADWRRVAPNVDRHVAVYAFIERVGMPKGYRLSACAP